jgi:hypothetical protein
MGADEKTPDLSAGLNKDQEKQKGRGKGKAWLSIERVTGRSPSDGMNQISV